MSRAVFAQIETTPFARPAEDSVEDSGIIIKCSREHGRFSIQGENYADYSISGCTK